MSAIERLSRMKGLLPFLLMCLILLSILLLQWRDYQVDNISIEERRGFRHRIEVGEADRLELRRRIEKLEVERH
jgi:small-conductance mechanosensitive channel